MATLLVVPVFSNSQGKTPAIAGAFGFLLGV
jgi:hypothetical protein